MKWSDHASAIGVALIAGALLFLILFVQEPTVSTPIVLRYHGFQIVLNEQGQVREVRDGDTPVAGNFSSFEDALRWIDSLRKVRGQVRPSDI